MTVEILSYLSAYFIKLKKQAAYYHNFKACNSLVIWLCMIQRAPSQPMKLMFKKMTMKKIIPFAIIGLMSSFAAFAQSGESLQTPALNQEQALSSPVNKTLFTADSIRWKQARKAPWFVERFRLSAGFFTAVNNTNIKLGNNSGSIGTDIDFENDLGFNRQIQTFMADFQWRISRRSRVNFSYYALNRSSSYSLQKTIKFGDSTFNLNANVKGIFNNTIYRISWGYAIIAK
ncbi:MAG: hypothetical protein RLZZ28_215, partial [Bacteroidota bacterium]